MTPIEDPSAAGRWDLRDPAVLLATGFGLGLLPVAPGTWASLAALPAAWGIVEAAGRPGLAIAAVAAFIAGLWAAESCVRGRGQEDPAPVVIDEIAGQWLVLVAVIPDPIQYGLGFALFRAFDILKPWPVSWADRAVRGGVGVMLDDVLAAAYAVLALLVIQQIWGG